MYLIDPPMGKNQTENALMWIIHESLIQENFNLPRNNGTIIIAEENACVLREWDVENSRKTIYDDSIYIRSTMKVGNDDREKIWKCIHTDKGPKEWKY